MCPEQVCGERLQPRDRYESYHPRYCDRPVTEEIDGAWYCKRHADTVRKRIAKSVAYTEQRQAEQDYMRRLDALGMDAKPVWNARNHAYDTNRVSVPLEWLEEAVKRGIPRNVGEQPIERSRNVGA